MEYLPKTSFLKGFVPNVRVVSEDIFWYTAQKETRVHILAMFFV